MFSSERQGVAVSIDFNNPEVMRRVVRLLIENTPVAYIVLDKEYRVHYINDFFLKFRKLDKEKVIGQKCYAISNGGVPCDHCAVRQSIDSGENVAILRKDVLPDGTVRYMDDISIPLRKNNAKTGEFDYLLELMINRTKEMLLFEKTQDLFLRVVELLVHSLEKKDVYTSNHSRDVSRISAKLARYMGMNDDEVFVIELAGLLHDIGKVYVADEIINKPSKLDDAEFKEIQKHPAGSAKLLEKLNGFASIKEMAANHHEKWNGKGYPGGLQGEAISVGARILAIADTYDAMTSDRSYRKGLSHETAIEEIIRFKEIQFAPQEADAFVRMAEELYPSREALVEKGSKKSNKKCPKGQVERLIQKNQGECSSSTAEENSAKLEEMLSDDVFIQQIYENTPAFYTIIDDQFNVLSVSDSIVKALGMSREQLTCMKCFEVNNKNMKCFTVKNGVLTCPSVRAFQTGTVQMGNVTEAFGDDELHFDIFSAPIYLQNTDGEEKQYVMEILFDRTEEVKLRQAIEKDIKHIVDLLTEISGYVEPESDGEFNKLKEHYGSIDKYLQDVEALVSLE